MLPCEDVINSKACFASAPRPTAADYRELKSVGYSPIEIAEIAYLAANNSAALPNDPLEEVEANWFDKLKRPFTRKDFRALLFPIFKVSPLPAHTGPGAAIESVRRLPGRTRVGDRPERSVGICDYLEARQGACVRCDSAESGL
jgi:hypothetical protein